MKECKYIKFVLFFAGKKKTNTWQVVNKNHESVIGIIKWLAPWRQYSFFPYDNTIYSWDCLRLISDFIQEQMLKRK